MRDKDIELLNQSVDISNDFKKYDNTYFFMDKLVDFKKNKGKIKWSRFNRKYRMSFNSITAPLEKTNSWEFPNEYEIDEIENFKINFISKNAIRIQMDAKHREITEKESIMLDRKIKCVDSNIVDEKDKIILENKKYKIILIKDPFNIKILTKDNKKILSTYQNADNKSLDNSYPIPFSYIRDNKTLKRKMVASFNLNYDEKIFGLGESFTRLNKRGQKLNLWTYDALGAQSKDMYKPIPFLISNKGYGIFLHTSARITCDIGHDYDSNMNLYVDDDKLDLFIFLGTPKEIVSEYTKFTGRAKMPPIWSFGLWMSRITYDNEKQVREVVDNFRNLKIPLDVIHLDTGWFEEDWKCNYKFSKRRFENPKKMIKDLNENGVKISLWQLPYITPTNSLYNEAYKNGYYVKGLDGEVPTEDIIIDFSNNEAINWYKNKLKSLFEIGISAIKVDFGEAAPYNSIYSSGKSGRYEHNLYPLRYNKVVSDITNKCNNENIIWARSAWAGSQRYPLHWGGDAEITDGAMAATLRAGLSLGLCGFTFWSNDIGGFTKKSPEELYARWLAFGMMCSHSRAHGQPPKEPWEYSEEFSNLFKKIVELKYNLLPYILEESQISCNKGYPLIRTLFFEYPDDETCYNIEDQYFLGKKIMIAPLFEENKGERLVYLPKGIWVNYFNKKEYIGEKYYKIKKEEIPIIMFVKKGTCINKIPIFESTKFIDWNQKYCETY
ncbi:glycoside hydrolase family 31 protein [Oceanivirga salmonicida]|uniref:glycoside hydrolase family 31 protein n=1 Tax=Oceanivirga salmonicida TaxID=1769291 RepID=UPI0012E2283D|nr:TIM-barrel domain-containing protein [Oceanivirga salmonicida]